MLVAILVIVSFCVLLCLINTAILLLLGSAVVQLIEKFKTQSAEKPVRQEEKPWYAEI